MAPEPRPRPQPQGRPNDQSECDIPLLYYPGVIIFPQETIPLRIPKQLWSDLHTLSRQQGHYQGNDKLPYNYFGLVNKRHHLSRNDHVSMADRKFSKIGTIIRVRSRFINNDEMTDNESSPNHSLRTNDVSVTAEGVSRFELKSTYHINGVTMGSIEILPEPIGQLKRLQVNPFPNWVSAHQTRLTFLFA